MAKVTIQYWAAAREAAGLELESVEASTLAEALEVVVARRGDGGSPALGARRVLVPGGRRGGQPRRSAWRGPS